MKKVYLILTLFMTSFFLLSSNVSADVIEISDEVMDYVRNEEFLKLREKTISFCEENDKYYYISYISAHDSYLSMIIPKNIYYVKKNVSNYYLLYPDIGDFDMYKLVDNELTYYSKTSGMAQLIYKTNFKFNVFLDTNIDFVEFKQDIEFTLQYNDSTYTFKQGDNYPSLYEIYQNFQLSQTDPKAEIVTNFYILIIDKIKLLTNYIATDYIILSALVIFIFVAVIGLVRRLK